MNARYGIPFLVAVKHFRWMVEDWWFWLVPATVSTGSLQPWNTVLAHWSFSSARENHRVIKYINSNSHLHWSELCGVSHVRQFNLQLKGCHVGMLGMGFILESTICLLCPKPQKTNASSLKKKSLLMHCIGELAPLPGGPCCSPEWYYVCRSSVRLSKTYALNSVRIAPLFQLFWRIYFM